MTLFNADFSYETANQQTEMNNREDVLQPLQHAGLCVVMGKLEPGKDYDFRFLPPFNSAGAFFIPVRSHYFTKSKPFVCPENFGAPCPACERSWDFYKKGVDSKDQDPRWSELRANDGFYWPCLHTNGNDPERVNLLRVPRTLHTTGLFGGEYKKSKVTGNVITEIKEYIERLKEEDKVPAEMVERGGAHPLYFLLSEQYGRKIRVQRTGSGVTDTSYSARVIRIDQAYPIQPTLVNHDWTIKLREVIWDNFDHARFDAAIEIAAEGQNDTSVFIPSEETMNTEPASPAPDLLGSLTPPKEEPPVQPEDISDDDIEIPFDTKEPSTVKETKTVESTKEEKKEKPKPKATEKKEPAKKTPVKRSTIDSLAMLKLPQELAGKKRPEIITMFLSEYQDIASDFAARHAEIPKDDPESIRNLAQEYADIIQGTYE